MCILQDYNKIIILFSARFVSSHACKREMGVINLSKNRKHQMIMILGNLFMDKS